MILRGNQAAVRICGGTAIKTYHGQTAVSSSEYFRFEVSNLRRISGYRGCFLGFQLPVLYWFSEPTMTIAMSAVDRSAPYVVDFCPMVRDRRVFDRFLDHVFKDYVCATHRIAASSERLTRLRACLVGLADECEIYYTDPKPGNVRL